jgi:methylmalonyl-CoA mutase
MTASAKDAAITLAAEFPPATRRQWRKLVEATLKGADFDKRLVGQTYDGLRIEPLYARRPDAMLVFGRKPAAPWQVLQRVDHPDAAASNAEALHDLENGAAGLCLVFAGSIGAHGYGLAPGTIARALDGVYLDAGIAIECDLNEQAKGATDEILAVIKTRRIAPKDTQIRFGFDPIGAVAARGQSALRWRDLAEPFARSISSLAEHGFAGPFAAADARVIHNAGGSEAQELGYALAVAVAYMRALEAHGIALDAARRMIFFRLSADADQFLTMAKFRSLRKLWARIEESCGLTAAPIFVSAETAWRMMTKRDPYANMLRVTIAAFAAGVGGADAITVLPFTSALGLPDRFARRIACNAQLILLEESNLDKVADPAAGSGGIEDLTDKLCAASWALFQEIEAAGGIARALETGLVQNKVAEVRAMREAAVATREDALTGTSEFPDIFEQPATVLDVAPSPASAAEAAAIRFPALPSIRLAEPYERLRDASDCVLAAVGSRPKIFLANLGTPADFTARATFAKNLFEAGGIEAVTNDGFSSCEEMVAAFKASAATLACLCSSDATYAKGGADAARALATAGAKHIYMAGRPGADAQKLAASGVNTFVDSGCDALATLRAAHDILQMRAERS